MPRLMSAAALVATIAFHGVAHGSNKCRVGGHAATSAEHSGKNLEYSANDIEVVVHRGVNGGTMAQYVFNPIDKPASIHCESAGGCLLIAHATANAPNAGGFFLCTFLDGKALDQRWEVAPPRTSRFHRCACHGRRPQSPNQALAVQRQPVSKLGDYLHDVRSESRSAIEDTRSCELGHGR